MWGQLRRLVPWWAASNEQALRVPLDAQVPVLRLLDQMMREEEEAIIGTPGAVVDPIDPSAPPPGVAIASVTVDETRDLDARATARQQLIEELSRETLREMAPTVVTSRSIPNARGLCWTFELTPVPALLHVQTTGGTQASRLRAASDIAQQCEGEFRRRLTVLRVEIGSGSRGGMSMALEANGSCTPALMDELIQALGLVKEQEQVVDLRLPVVEW